MNLQIYIDYLAVLLKPFKNYRVKYSHTYTYGYIDSETKRSIGNDWELKGPEFYYGGNGRYYWQICDHLKTRGWMNCGVCSIDKILANFEYPN